jgi:hypothetical protein
MYLCKMKNKKEKKDKEQSLAKEPTGVYAKKSLRIYNSFEEQEKEELLHLASLSPIEVLRDMRRFINTAYGMHGFDPNNLPKKHSIKIISYKGKML